MHGIAGATSDALGWTSHAAHGAVNGVGDAASDAAGWAAKTGSRALRGIAGAEHQASAWLNDTVSRTKRGANDGIASLIAFGGEAKKAIGGWEDSRASEMKNGVNGAAHQSMQWTGSRISEAENGVGGAAHQAANWTGSRLGEMGSGIGGAAHQATDWAGNRAGEMGSGIGGFAQQASHLAFAWRGGKRHQGWRPRCLPLAFADRQRSRVGYRRRGKGRAWLDFSRRSWGSEWRRRRGE